ncbi:metal transporting ATPase [Psychromonas sp. CNPT3]|uniref:heavy metal translocating P-type ATPase n=1 Tax=Psychromonas sp. CNPT3 TaxID=314282 RepID=UPI00006E8AB8|nr:heavy metal translocating P-type ATPase [Psychromonas sp. CNPT3]AGH80509.1 metal transporting ATPase [Psychromonas sp. CNPT3]
MNKLIVKSYYPGRIRFKLAILAHFENAAGWLKQGLLAIQGVKSVRINQAAKSLVIEYDPLLLNNDVLKHRLQQIDLTQASDIELDHEYTKGEITLNLLGSLSTLFLPGRIGALTTLPLIADTIFNGAKILADKKIKVEVLDAIALSLSVYRGDYKTAMLTQSLLTLGEYMEQQTSRKSDQLLAELMQPKISDVWIERDKQKILIKSDKIKQQEILVLGPGDAIPVDGHILSGEALINQASLTGESVPVARESGAYVYAGTLVQEGNIKVIAEKVGCEATTARIAQFIASSLSQKSEIQEVTQEMADRRVNITLAVGGAVFALTQDINRVASVFLVDYSCALKLSTPVAFKSMIYRAAKQGILLKGGRAIEQAVKIDTCVFDKTGTLTYGDMEVSDVICLDTKNNAKQLLAIAASVEEHCHHPLSQAIVNAAKHHKLPHIEHGEVEYVIAHGLKSHLNDKELILGSRHFLESHEGIDFKNHEETIEILEQQGLHLLFVSHHQQLIGLIALKDHLRKEAYEVLQGLKKRGIKKLVLLTGDKQAPADKLAKKLGIDVVFAQATPEDKANIVKQLQRQGDKVLYIGDGVNDAPALTMADIGLAMNKSTELAQQTADVVLLQDDLYGIEKMLDISHEAMRLINSNIRLAEVVNTGIMGAAALGWLNPAASALLHNGTTLAVILRSLAAKDA